MWDVSWRPCLSPKHRSSSIYILPICFQRMVCLPPDLNPTYLLRISSNLGECNLYLNLHSHSNITSKCTRVSPQNISCISKAQGSPLPLQIAHQCPPHLAQVTLFNGEWMSIDNASGRGNYSALGYSQQWSQWPHQALRLHLRYFWFRLSSWINFSPSVHDEYLVKGPTAERPILVLP